MYGSIMQTIILLLSAWKPFILTLSYLYIFDIVVILDILPASALISGHILDVFIHHS